MNRCDTCKKAGYIHTLCKACFPKDDKSDVAEVNALWAGDLTELMPVKLCPLGYCPVCLLEGEMRERRLNGNDTCIQGHTYPSIDALKVPIRNYIDSKGMA
jgi:hypothetical protein